MKDQSIAFKAEMIRALFNESCPKTQTRRLNLEKQYFVGQRLWVKENWQTGNKLDKFNAGQIQHMAEECGFLGGPFSPLFYPATETHRRWCEADKRDFGEWGRIRIARFMPRWASRITLDVTAVREERLQDITSADAVAEGIEMLFSEAEKKASPWLTSDSWKNYLWHGLGVKCDHWRHQYSGYSDPIGAYSSLWESINGPGNWDENPVVKVISFKMVTA